MAKKFVVPGDEVGVMEEYSPASGVYSKGGDLYSAAAGGLELNAQEHTAKIDGIAKPPKFQRPASTVVGVVAELNDKVAIVDLMPMETEKSRLIKNEASAVLRVSNVRRSYVNSLKDEMGIGDVIRARITEVSEHSVGLRVDDNDLGVIKAFCKACRQPLVLNGTALKCGSCGHVESRKIAEDYGTGRIV
jgi:exosome complex component CSL4